MDAQKSQEIQPENRKKTLIRRIVPDRSQRIRRAVQAAFLLLNGWIGLRFFLWARTVQQGAEGAGIARPAGVDGWLPIAGLMNTKYLLWTGRVPVVHPAAMFLFLSFLIISMVLKKAFCSWLCPVGTLSEALWKLGRKITGRNLHLPRWADLPLRGVKYLLLSFFVLIIGGMSAEALAEFMTTPDGLFADLKLMNFFTHMGLTAAIVLGLLVVLSVFIKNFWCRYACPYGALLGLASVLSPLKIRRDAGACIDCGKCARACPAALPVDRLLQIRSAECSACMECVAACPAQDALQLAFPPRRAATIAQRWARRAIGPLVVTGLLAYILFGMILYARVTGHWQTVVPAGTYTSASPQAGETANPVN